MRAIEILGGFGLDHLKLVDRPDPAPGPGQVVVAMKAASLNYRDLLVATGKYNPKMPLPRIPCSDGAGVVEAVGEGVSTVKVGDRVASTFFQGWVSGGYNEAVGKTALGGAIDGVLAERVVLEADGVVPIPGDLSFEEAATLPCAALTAWHGLVESGHVKAGESVLVQGTGGVSLFALQFARLHGARVIVTSSGDEKLRKAMAMGASDGVNYKDTPDWDKRVVELTGGVGVDHVVEVGGSGTLGRSVQAVRAGGHIAVDMVTEQLPPLAKGAAAHGVNLLMLIVCLFVAFYGARLCVATWGQSIAELDWLPVGLTYTALPLGSIVTLLFVVERMLFGSQAERRIVRYEDQLVEAVEAAH